ncbi:MAG: hypothetical protein A2Y62_21420 [Candidatus Fischerbacteria bacterium RBG_13_37_8]|uniref:Transposase IS4-like domain-containing protein n=1 Tax=Candidatus Fischerbacteria bacterium RBG_13_37_8 TaxID=1817863 RepID=A0A1F5VJS2_9BACT|nr:MAG: hypothetical protein A2Y62_21420 [Candidatus Fischerbacteria bacterium RBG_13_37_8]
MKHYSKLSGKIKQQVTIFSNNVTAGEFTKPIRRAIREFIYGIQAEKDIKIASVARSLNEQIALIKVETRLSNNLNKEDYFEKLHDKIIQMASKYIREDTVLAIDPGDVVKKYAKQMEYLYKVRDGSTGNIEPGYPLIHVAAADVSGEVMIPLLMKLYSSIAPGFLSENKEILDAIDFVVKRIGQKGIWTIDRGGDRKKIIEHLLEKNLRFVIRLKGDRHLLAKQEGVDKWDKQDALAIAKQTKCRHYKWIKKKKEGEEIPKKVRVTIGAHEVIFPGCEGKPMTIIVVKGYSKTPMMLLTNVEANYAHDTSCLEKIVDIYLTRWKCDENYRFLKTSYNAEDVRALKYIGIKNTFTLLLAVFYFLCVFLGFKTRLNLLVKEICEKAQRFFEIPEYKWYALSDGVYKILSKTIKPFTAPSSRHPPSTQTILFPKDPYFYAEPL